MKEISSCAIQQTAPDDYSLSVANGWRRLAGTTRVFVSDTFFDLGGMSQREKTMFFEGATVQEMFNPEHTGGVAGDDIVVYDIMSTFPMDDAQLISFVASGNFMQSSSGLGFEQTIYGRVRQFIIDLDTAAWGSFIAATDNQIGSLNASAGDRVYCYRMVHITGGTSITQLNMYYARYLLRTEAKEEAEYQYLMRLRKSYELQQSYDED